MTSWRQLRQSPLGAQEGKRDRRRIASDGRFRTSKGGWMCGWIFRDWRDDICLVYGKTYARVRTAEVRRSINRPLLKSHVNGTRVYPAHVHTVRTHTHRVYRYACLLEHRANPREKFARAFLSTFCERELRSFYNSPSTVPAIDSVFSLSLSLFLSLSLSHFLSGSV